MMCEASENDVEVNESPQVSTELAADQDKTRSGNYKGLTNNQEYRSKSDDYSGKEGSCDQTLDGAGLGNNQSNHTEVSAISRGDSDMCTDLETSANNEDKERYAQDEGKETNESVTPHNTIDAISENPTSEHAWNGHTNGTSEKNENQKETIDYQNGSDIHRNTIGIQSPRPSIGHIGISQGSGGQTGAALATHESEKVEIKPIPIGDQKVRSKIRFEVVTARVIETGGKKHVAYTIMMKRVGHEPHPAVIERRYSDFCFVYECILRSFHPSILGDFMFPKKVLIGNFKAEVISERTDAFHKFLNLIASCDNLLYSDYFYSFLSSEEHNEAVSHLKLARYSEAIPLLESIFYVREKLLSVGSIHVLLCSCELIACLSAEVTSGIIDRRRRRQEAYAYAQVAAKSFDIVYQSSNADEIMVAESLRIPYLKLALELATELGQDKRTYVRQLSELRYAGVRLENASSLLEVIRDRYIHRASHTSKIS